MNTSIISCSPNVGGIVLTRSSEIRRSSRKNLNNRYKHQLIKIIEGEVNDPTCSIAEAISLIEGAIIKGGVYRTRVLSALKMAYPTIECGEGYVNFLYGSISVSEDQSSSMNMGEILKAMELLTPNKKGVKIPSSELLLTVTVNKFQGGVNISYTTK